MDFFCWGSNTKKHKSILFCRGKAINRRSRNSLPLPQTGAERNLHSKTPYDRSPGAAPSRSQIPVPVAATTTAASTSSGSASNPLPTSSRQRKRTWPIEPPASSSQSATSSSAPPASRTRSNQPTPPKKARHSASQATSQPASQQQQQPNLRTNIGTGTSFVFSTYLFAHLVVHLAY